MWDVILRIKFLFEVMFRNATPKKKLKINLNFFSFFFFFFFFQKDFIIKI